MNNFFVGNIVVFEIFIIFVEYFTTTAEKHKINYYLCNIGT